MLLRCIRIEVERTIQEVCVLSELHSRKNRLLQPRPSSALLHYSFSLSALESKVSSRKLTDRLCSEAHNKLPKTRPVLPSAGQVEYV
jgi:hypothetical protein